MATLREHSDGMLYIVHIDRDFDKPIEYRTWWPLGMKAHHYRRDYGEYRIGQEMYQGRNPGEYLGADGLKYRLVNGGQTVSTYTEKVDVDKPKTKLPVRWYRGRWEKQTARGWVIA